MAISINTVKELQQYFKGIEEKAEDHAKQVKEVIYPTLCLIIAYFDPDSDIEVRPHKGDMANMLWAHINGIRYSFVYKPEKSAIEIKKGRQVKHSIDNTLTVKELISIFESLKNPPASGTM